MKWRRECLLTLVCWFCRSIMWFKMRDGHNSRSIPCIVVKERSQMQAGGGTMQFNGGGKWIFFRFIVFSLAEISRHPHPNKYSQVSPASSANGLISTRSASFLMNMSYMFNSTLVTLSATSSRPTFLITVNACSLLSPFIMSIGS